MTALFNFLIGIALLILGNAIILVGEPTQTGAGFGAVLGVTGGMCLIASALLVIGRFRDRMWSEPPKTRFDLHIEAAVDGQDRNHNQVIRQTA